MKSNIANILKRLTVPYGAAQTQPRIVIATDDPLAVTFSDAAQSFYFGDGKGFVESVEDSAGTGIWRLSAAPAGATFADREEYIHAEYDPADPSLDTLQVGAGNRAGVTGWFRSWVDVVAGVLQGVAELRGDRVDIIGEPYINDRLLCLDTANAYVDAGTGTSTALTTYADMTDVPAVACKKVYPSTKSAYRVRVTLTLEANAPCVARFAVNVGTSTGPGTDFSVGKVRFADANKPVTLAIERDLTSVGAGDRVIQLRWRVADTSGASLLFGANHCASMTISEIGLRRTA